MGVRPNSRQTVNYLRFTFRIALVLMLLIPIPAHTSKLEDIIVYVSRTHGTLKSELFLVEGLNGKPIQLTRNMFASSPSISPDGTEVVFVSRPPGGLSNIFHLHIATRRIKKLTEDAEWADTKYTNLDWSPDGQRILFIMDIETPEGGKTDLCVMDMKTREIRHILQPDPPTYIWHPSWSPNSQHIIYSQLYEHGLFITDNNGKNIVNVKPDQSVERTAIMPAWSPSRSQIAYIGVIVTKPLPPNPLHIYRMNLAEERVTVLTFGGTENRVPLAFRPDGRNILFAFQSSFDEEIESSDIYVMDADGKNMINLTNTPEKEQFASWSPDGKQIVFDISMVAGQSAIFVMGANGQNSRRLTFEPGINGAPHWSPDGNKIAFLSSRDGTPKIYTMNTDGQNVRQITHRQRKFYGAPAWSPDGKWLAFTAGDERDWGLFLIDPHGHDETPIIRSKVSQLDGRVIFRPAWSPDSRNLIYIDPEADDDVGLMRIRADGGLPTQLIADGLEYWWSPVWSPDGNSLLFGAKKKREPIFPETEYGIFLMKLNTSKRREFIFPGIKELAFESDWSLRRLVWAPDGSQLMLSIGQIGIDTPQEKRLYLIDIASETIRLWMDDADVADWVRPGFVYAVNPSGKRLSTWAETERTGSALMIHANRFH